MAALRKLEMEIPARQGVLPRPPLGSIAPGLDGLALLIAVAVSGLQPALIACALLTFAALNLDSSRAFRLDPQVGKDMGWLLGRVSVPPLIVVSIVSLDLVPWLGQVGELDRLVVAGSVGAVLVLVGRAAAYAIGRAARARGLVSEKTLIVGSGRLGVALADALGRHPEYGLEPIGFIDGPTSADLPHPLLGGPQDLERVVQELGVRRLVVAFGHGGDGDLTLLLRELEGLPLEIHIVPRLFELGSVPPGAADSVLGIPLVHLRRPALRAFARLTKRAFDAVVASVMLLLTSPLLLIAAVAVRMSSPGPVLFRQSRVGRHGRSFEILKFRTMLVNEDSDTAWSAKDDQLTTVGRVLRRTSVDELPQLINVVRGEMSLVGPRPERPYFVERFSTSFPGYVDRLRVEGGITGLGQVHGNRGPGASIAERARFDNLYIDTWSLWGDILIMLRTLRLVVFHEDGGSAKAPNVPSEDGASSTPRLIDLTEAGLREQSAGIAPEAFDGMGNGHGTGNGLVRDEGLVRDGRRESD